MSTLDEDTGEIKDEFVADIAPDGSGPKRRGPKPYPRDEAGNIIRSDGSKGKAPGRPRSRVSLEAQLDAFVTLVNILVGSFRPGYELEPFEQSALVKSLDQQCQTSPKFRKYVEKFLVGGGGINLLGVVGLIAARRIARANLIPIPEGSPLDNEKIDNMAGLFLQKLTTKTVTGLNV